MKVLREKEKKRPEYEQFLREHGRYPTNNKKSPVSMESSGSGNLQNALG